MGKHFLDEKNKVRKVKHTQASVGSKFKNRSKSKEFVNTVGKFNIKPLPKKEEIIGIVRKCQKCCKNATCFLSHCMRQGDNFRDEGALIDLNKVEDVVNSCRSKLRMLCKDELHEWVALRIRDAVKTSNASRKVSTRKGKKKVSVFTYSFKVSYKKQSFNTCRKAWSYLYGLSDHLVKATTTIVKNNGIENPHPTGDWSDSRPYTDATILPFSANEVQQIFEDALGDDYEEVKDEFVTAALSPHHEPNHDAAIWIEDYFDAVADHSPNGELKKISAPFKKDIWMDYVNEKKGDQCSYVSYEAFRSIWSTCFPTYVIRKYCGIPGKCGTCAAIDGIRAEKGAPKEKKRAGRQCHVLHRGGMFNLERKAFLGRKNRAIRNKHRIMSLVVDGMDQSHSQLPYPGPSEKFVGAINQHLTGVLMHGYGVKLYRNFDNVSKSADLTIFCILDSLRRWRDANDSQWPEEIYIQVDGASDNANKYVLGMCELLVAKKMAKLVIFSRLPVGHTHGDIDAAFGHLWKYLCKTPSVTVEAYQEAINNRFKNTKLKTEVIDVYVIPDYRLFFGDCIDIQLANLHKEEQTQLQWKFESVPKTAQFPLGVQASWRAYCSDR